MSFRYSKLSPAPKRAGYNRIGAASIGNGMTVNTAYLNSFWIPNLKTYRYINYNVQIQAGGLIQFAVYNSLFQRLAVSSQFAFPAAGKQQVDLGAFALPAGNYFLAVSTDTAGNSLWGVRDLTSTLVLNRICQRAAAGFPMPNPIVITLSSGDFAPNLVLEAA